MPLACFLATGHNPAAIQLRGEGAPIFNLGRMDKPMFRSRFLNACGVVLIVVAVVAPAAIHYRLRYDCSKRLRIVTPGKVYRSGQLSEAGFREAVKTYGLKTILNLQDESPEPVFDTGRLESQVCAELGVRYVFLPPDLIARKKLAKESPAAMGAYLAIMDDPASYPVLLHCRAGLHRTGTLAALYRIEYEGWSPIEAIVEMQQNGFGLLESTCRNDYLDQYLLTRHPRPRPERAQRGLESEAPRAVSAKDHSP
jgi:protein tyrosine phosphatase (PTP) superfamily phosphohydrolase (DUF442 family)